jgi:hypothetical protein
MIPAKFRKNLSERFRVYLAQMPPLTPSRKKYLLQSPFGFPSETLGARTRIGFVVLPRYFSAADKCGVGGTRTRDLPRDRRML